MIFLTALRIALDRLNYICFSLNSFGLQSIQVVDSGLMIVNYLLTLCRYT